MSAKANTTVSYDDAKQKMLLRYMISDPDAFLTARQIIQPKYWSEKMRSTTRFILEYSDKYKSLPTPDIIEASTSLSLQITETSLQHRDWFLTEIEQFCRHKAMEALIHDGPDLLMKGLSGHAELERRTKENMQISLKKNLGTDYFGNPLERLERLRDRKNMFTTGYRDLDDKLYGGMNRGELTIFAGGPGGGKSLMLQNLAINWMKRGLNVVYISLELSEDLVALRWDAMLTERTTKEVFKNIEEVSLALATLKKTNDWGHLRLIKLPESGTNANTLHSVLKEFEIQTGIRPDAVIVDYLDLLHANDPAIKATDLFVKDKYTSEELRALSGEWNVLCATASQLGRTSIGETEFNQSHIAGGISKINTADNVVAVFLNREGRTYQMQFLKTRSSPGVGSIITLSYNPDNLQITDMDEYQRDKGFSSAENVMKVLKSKEEVKENVPKTEEDVKNSADKLRALANKVRR